MGETVEFMERVGAYLRREREARGLSLDEVMQQTKIQRVHLDAIERDDFQSLPAGPFVSGFISTYARLLGLKPESVLAMLPQDEDSAAAFVPERTEADRRGPRMEIRELPVGGRNSSWIVWLVLGLLILLVAIGALIFWQLPTVRGWLGMGVVDRLAGAVSNAGPARTGNAPDAGKGAGAQGVSSARNTLGEAGGTADGAGDKAAAGKASESKGPDGRAAGDGARDGKSGDDKALTGAGAKSPKEAGSDSSKGSAGSSTAGSSTAGSTGSEVKASGPGTAGAGDAGSTRATSGGQGGSVAGPAGAGSNTVGSTGSKGASSTIGRPLETSASGIQRLASIESELDKQTYQVFADPGRASSKPQTVNVTALSKTYLRVSSGLDGSPVYEGVLKGGDRKEFQSQNDLWMVVGNGGGVELYYDGHPLPAPGRYGERIGLAFRISAGH